MSSMRTMARVSLAFAAVACAAAPAAAFRMIQNTAVGRVSAGYAVPCNASGGFTHWNSRAITWYLNPTGQGLGKEVALQSAMTSWTNVPGADHVLTLAGPTSAGFVTDNRNTAVWAH